MIYQFLALLFVHWIADFVLQTHWQASNKSKNIVALLGHVGTYTLVLAIATPFIFGDNMPGKMFAFVTLNSVLHLSTDFGTSRITSKLYAKQDWHNFFVVVGFDQLIHQVTLALTMIWIFG